MGWDEIVMIIIRKMVFLNSLGKISCILTSFMKYVVGYLLGKLIRPSPMVCLWKDIVWLTICRVGMSWIVLVCYFVEGYPDSRLCSPPLYHRLPFSVDCFNLVSDNNFETTDRYRPFFAVQFSGSIIVLANWSDILNQFFGIIYFFKGMFKPPCAHLFVIAHAGLRCVACAVDVGFGAYGCYWDYHGHWWRWIASTFPVTWREKMQGSLLSRKDWMVRVMLQHCNTGQVHVCRTQQTHRFFHVFFLRQSIVHSMWFEWSICIDLVLTYIMLPGVTHPCESKELCTLMHVCMCVLLTSIAGWLQRKWCSRVNVFMSSLSVFLFFEVVHVQKVSPNADNLQNITAGITGIYHIFASLCTTLHKDAHICKRKALLLSTL